MRTIRQVLVLTWGVLLLGCGGMMQGGRGIGLEKQGAKVMLLPESPQRAEVLSILAEAYFRNQQGEFETSENGDLRNALKEILADDEISSEEVVDLRSGREGWVRPEELDPARQASLLEFEAGVKRRIKGAQRKKKRAEARFREWSYPEDLEAKLNGIGVEVEKCRSRIDKEEGWMSASCAGRMGNDVIKVWVDEYKNASKAKEAQEWYEEVATRRDASYVLSIRYIDHDASEALARGVLAEAPFPKQSLKVIKKAAKKRGFSKKAECSTDKDSDGTDYNCEMWSGRTLAKIWVNPNKKEPEEDAFGRRGFEISHDDGYMRVTVEDATKAQAVMDRLF